MNSNQKAAPSRADPKLVGLINDLDRNLPALLAHVAMIAEIKRKYFTALLGEGFNETQALELCKHPASF